MAKLVGSKNRREQAKSIAELDHIKCKWNGEWGEFRVTLDGLSKEREEDVAYYVDDYDDAYDTAVAMSKERVNQLALAR